MPSLPVVEWSESGGAAGRWWSPDGEERILCELCPRACRLKPGDRGFCFVRANRDGEMVLDTYGRSTGFCIDPIEKKPLNHFFPGTPVLSFGTAGCNLGCKFCQNWDISKSREVARLSDSALPESIANAAQAHGCRSVAFTYNDPVIWAEYAIDTAAACHQAGIKTVAVTAGYITPQARGEFFASMDAANIDLKAFTEDFYFKLTGAHLDSVLDTIRYVCNETDCWVELTNLLIPDANDSGDELKRMCDWVLAAVGCEVPIHFTAFHPDFRMTDRPRTSHEVLIEAYELARKAGLRYVYVGNVHDLDRQSTYCPSCGGLLIQRDWHQLGQYSLRGNRCGHCDAEIAGHFESQPGNWGRRRQPLRIASETAAGPPAHTNVSPESPTTRKTVMQEATATPSESLDFSEQERQLILRAAAAVVAGAVRQTPTEDIEGLLGDLAHRAVAGVYVTLKRGETLRGCCGLQGPPVSLASALLDAGTRTACSDPRMTPVVPVELPYLSLSVSVIGSARPIGVSGDQRLDAVEVGRHGLRILMDGNAGLLLPVVAVERGWNSRQFLDALCRKAGLPPGTWRRDEAVIQLFDGVEFGCPLGEVIESSEGGDHGVATRDQLDWLRQWVQANLAAFQSGATPLYYAPKLFDATVSGVVLQIRCAADEEPSSWLQLKLTEGVPLQSTLFQLAQNAANVLAGRGDSAQWEVELGALTSLAHHGLDNAQELGGFDCQRRVLLALDGRRWSAQFDTSSEPQELFQRALSSQPFRSGATQIYSAVCDTTTDRFSVSMGPQAQAGRSVRPPGVAGGFYPAEDAQREQMVAGLFQGMEAVSTQQVNAAMVPHAGLRFSGRIAADVWRRIALPETVLIIGPKHTADGVDWAVAPHDQWQLSNTVRMPGAYDLAEQIAARVPGMQLDAAAHAREHGIEVQLPILHRLAPETRIAAIAMSGGGFAEVAAAAQALAEWIRGLKRPPLMVISSDLNHFADDTENRRRDALALKALESNDPRGLLDVCAREEISMCGQLPAALVLLTLQSLGKQIDYRQVGYATSGDVTGDRARVVGYAGVLF